MIDHPSHAPAPPPLPRSLLALAGLIALIEIALQLADAGWLADRGLRDRAYIAGAFWGELLRGAEPLFAAQPATMFITHALLHGGLLHMAMNTAVLLGLGRFAADRYGPGVVVPLFLLGAAAGAAVFAVLGGPYPMVGASGAVFGFLGLWIAWDWRRHRAAGITVRPVAMRVLALALVNAMVFVGLQGLLAWEAHLGGFLVGLAAGWLFEDRLVARARAARAEARRRRLGSGE
jgi:rhomboid protease GluP